MDTSSTFEDACEKALTGLSKIQSGIIQEADPELGVTGIHVQAHPHAHWEVDVSTLNMSCPRGCFIGQVHGNYETFWRDHKVPIPILSNMGVYVPQGARQIEEKYRIQRDAYIEVIMAARQRDIDNGVVPEQFAHLANHMRTRAIA